MESLTKSGCLQRSRSSPRRFEKRVERLAYLLVTRTGQVVAGHNGAGHPVLTPAPLVAVDAGMAWVSLPSAFNRLEWARRLWPELDVRLGQLRMARETATPGGWQAIEWRVLGGGE